jgi:hypothetical protein
MAAIARRASDRGEEDLALEALDAESLQEVGGEHLHHDASRERVLAREVRARHAAAAELALDRVAIGERLSETRVEGVH